MRVRLVDGLERLRANGIAAILLDLRLPDSQGIATFDTGLAGGAARPDPRHRLAGRRRRRRPQAVKRGAQDYLQRDRLDSHTLPRALKRIIERQAAEEALFFEQQRAEVTLNSIGDAVLSTDVAGQRDLSQSRGRTHDRLAASRGAGPAARRRLPDHRRRDTRTGAEPDGAGDAARPNRRPDPELPPGPARRRRDGRSKTPPPPFTIGPGR